MTQAVQVTCPNCQNLLRVPPTVGEATVKCKFCGFLLQLRTRAAAPPPPIAQAVMKGDLRAALALLKREGPTPVPVLFFRGAPLIAWYNAWSTKRERMLELPLAPLAERPENPLPTEDDKAAFFEFFTLCASLWVTYVHTELIKRVRNESLSDYASYKPIGK